MLVDIAKNNVELCLTAQTNFVLESFLSNLIKCDPKSISNEPKKIYDLSKFSIQDSFYFVVILLSLDSSLVVLRRGVAQGGQFFFHTKTLSWIAQIFLSCKIGFYLDDRVMNQVKNLRKYRLDCGYSKSILSLIYFILLLTIKKKVRS